MSEQKPMVSVTVCVRNGRDWIDECLESLVAQTYRPLEIIAIDDGSNDDVIISKGHGVEAATPIESVEQMGDDEGNAPAVKFISNAEGGAEGGAGGAREDARGAGRVQNRSGACEE